MDNPAALHAVVYGRVQGVFFRAFVAEKAESLGVVGFVKNVLGGAVEVWAEGEKKILEALIPFLKTGPPHARVDRVTIDWTEYTGNYADFLIKYD